MTEIRIDRVKLGGIKKTSNGFLKGVAPVTRTGVFVYTNMDGTERRELRHPDDVRDAKSLESLKSLPITNDHPSKLVDVENADTVLVGMTGESVEIQDDGFVMSSLTITNKDAIKAINAGKRELSAGYTVTLIPEVGEYNGEKYTHRQTNIDYNHLSLVDQGRAGHMVRLNLDGAFIQCDEIIEKQQEIMTIKQDKEAESLIEALAQTVVKETETEAPKVEVELEKAVEAEVNEVATEVSSNTDSLKSDLEKLRAENEELKKVNLDSLVIERTKQRTALLNKAASVVNVDSLLDKSEREIMEAAIASRLNMNMDFADKSDDYITGRFDATIEDLQFGIFRKQIANLDTKTSETKVTSLFGAIEKQFKSAV